MQPLPGSGAGSPDTPSALLLSEPFLCSTGASQGSAFAKAAICGPSRQVFWIGFSSLSSLVWSPLTPSGIPVWTKHGVKLRGADSRRSVAELMTMPGTEAGLPAEGIKPQVSYNDMLCSNHSRFLPSYSPISSIPLFFHPHFHVFRWKKNMEFLFRIIPDISCDQKLDAIL